MKNNLIKWVLYMYSLQGNKNLVKFVVNYLWYFASFFATLMKTVSLNNNACEPYFECVRLEFSSENLLFY
jgi:hypothetical protein